MRCTRRCALRRFSSLFSARQSKSCPLDNEIDVESAIRRAKLVQGPANELELFGQLRRVGPLDELDCMYRAKWELLYESVPRKSLTLTVT